MVVSYWDMAASFVTFGAIDREMFNATNGEAVAVFCKVEPFLTTIREKWSSPNYLHHLEDVARQHPMTELYLQQLAALRQSKSTSDS